MWQGMMIFFLHFFLWPLWRSIFRDSFWRKLDRTQRQAFLLTRKLPVKVKTFTWNFRPWNFPTKSKSCIFRVSARAALIFITDEQRKRRDRRKNENGNHIEKEPKKRRRNGDLRYFFHLKTASRRFELLLLLAHNRQLAATGRIDASFHEVWRLKGTYFLFTCWRKI